MPFLSSCRSVAHRTDGNGEGSEVSLTPSVRSAQGFSNSPGPDVAARCPARFHSTAQARRQYVDRKLQRSVARRMAQCHVFASVAKAQDILERWRTTTIGSVRTAPWPIVRRRKSWTCGSTHGWHVSRPKSGKIGLTPRSQVASRQFRCATLPGSVNRGTHSLRMAHHRKQANRTRKYRRFCRRPIAPPMDVCSMQSSQSRSVARGWDRAIPRIAFLQLAPLAPSDSKSRVSSPTSAGGRSRAGILEC